MFDGFDDDERLDDDEDAPAVRLEGGELPPPRANPECLGHGDIETMLLHLLEQDRLPHAMIFAGPKGIGKSTMAFRLARHLIASGNKEEETPSFDMFAASAPAVSPKADTLAVSSDHPVFRQLASGGHPDLLTVERPYDEKKDRHKDAVDIESVRKIAPFMRMTASREGGWRVAIIDDADTMTRQAQNAILKILEEPPRRAALILIAHRPGALIPTIRSRCRTVPFQPLPRDAFAALIRRIDPNLDDAGVATLQALSRGGVGQARDLLEEGGMEALEKLTALLAPWPGIDWPAIHALADAVGRAGAEEQYRLSADLLSWTVETLVRVKSGTGKLPSILQRAQKLLDSHGLNQWIAISETLNDHLRQISVSNLDRRQGIIGAFTILSPSA